MSLLFIAALMVVNFAICAWNAYIAGRAWYDAKAAGGFSRLVIWSAVVQSALGFTWVYMFLLALLAMALEALPVSTIDGFLSLGYVVIAPGLVLSGLVITAHSWAVAYKTKNLAAGGIAAWNTFASAYNVINVFRFMPKALEGALGALFPKNSKSSSGLVVVLLFLIALLGGMMTTLVITRSAMRSSVEKFKNDWDNAKRKNDWSDDDLVDADN